MGSMRASSCVVDMLTVVHAIVSSQLQQEYLRTYCWDGYRQNQSVELECISRRAVLPSFATNALLVVPAGWCECALKHNIISMSGMLHHGLVLGNDQLGGLERALVLGPQEVRSAPRARGAGQMKALQIYLLGMHDFFVILKPA